MNHRNTDKTCFRRCSMFITATKAAILRQPSIGSLDDPADGQLDEPLAILGPSDDNDLAARLPALDELGETSLGISGIRKDGVEARILLRVDLRQAGNATCPVRHVASGDDHGQQQPKAVHHQVPLPPLQPLAAVKGAAFPRPVRVRRLAIDAGRRPRRRLVFLTHLLAQAVMDARQRPFLLPLVEVVVDRLPRRELMRQHPPLTPAPRDVENAIDDTAEINLARTPGSLLWRDKELDDLPLRVSRVARISFAVHSYNLRKTAGFGHPPASHSRFSSWKISKQTLRRPGVGARR